MIKLDARDFDILRVLSREGRMSKARLSEAIGLSPTPVWERLKKLEKAGVVEGYGARINLRKLGPSVTVFVSVELSDHRQASFRAFEAAIADRPEISACWALGGGFDYLLQVVARDIEAYQVLIDALLDAQIGIERYFTYIVTKQVKGAGLPPLEVFSGER